MKASEDTENEFVIVRREPRGLVAWTAPRGRKAEYRLAWTLHPDNAMVYRSWQAADKAIARNRAGWRAKEFIEVRLCTFGEWRRGEVQL